MCNPEEYYPFSKYSLPIILIELIVPTITIGIGLLAILSARNKKRKNLQMTVLFKIFYLFSLFCIYTGVNLCFDRIPRAYAFHRLHKNYKVVKSQIISVDTNPKGYHLGKYLVQHKATINNKNELFETSVYNSIELKKLRGVKLKEEFWVYYNPDNPKIFLADFRFSTNEQKPACN